MKKKLIFMALLFVLTIAASSVHGSAKTYEDEGFQYRVSKKAAVVTDLIKDGDRIVVPSTLGGFPVKQIASYAFSNSKMSTVSLPASVEIIGAGAFRNCTKLKEITLPAKLVSIGYEGFYGCSVLTSVKFNENLKDILTGAFSNCISLKKIELPKNLQEIGTRAFEKCYKLETVKLNSKLSTIGKQAFYKAYSLKSIRIPAGVDEIRKEAFSKCEDLSGVTFAGQKTQLGNGLFYKCSSLKKVELPKKLTYIPEGLFENCVKLNKVTIPKNISIIKKRAFYGCQSLKSVKLNQKVYAIGDSAFAGSGLKKLKLNKKMQFIGNGAFRETKLGSLKLTSKVTFIGNRVFSDCKKLKTIYVPASVKGINPGAFNNCTSLRAIHVAAGNKNYSSADGVLYDKGKSKLIQYPLHKTNKLFRTPGSLKKIRSNAFAENKYLVELTTSADVIGSSAFYRMSRLKKVNILNGTTQIENGAFQCCYRLAELSLPDSVTYIGSLAFSESNIRRVKIPSRLKSLGADTFYGCDQIQAFEGGSSSYKVENGVLYNGSMTELIKYPARKRGTVFSVPKSVRTVRKEAFHRTNSLTKLEFSSGLKTLRYSAISDAKNLKSIVFDNCKLSYGSSGGVRDCDKLAVIVGPNRYVMQKMAEKAGATLITL